MLQFDPADPYPLLQPGEASYAEEKSHAVEVDRWLGLQVEALESRLRAGFTPTPDQELWIGLPAQSLLTPYTELRRLLHGLDLPPGQAVVDLGAGYGRLGFLMARHYPLNPFIGLELVAERVAEGARCLKLHHPDSHCRLERADLAQLAPPASEFYFLYDFGSKTVIRKVLADLRLQATRSPITVLGRGRATRDVIEQEHPWLSQVVPPRHGPRTSIYRSG